MLGLARQAAARDVRAAIQSAAPGLRELAAMLAPAAAPFLEEMAARAQSLTARHFGRTITLYVPLYLSNYCSGGCRYCGYAADRQVHRKKLQLEEAARELRELKRMGFEEVLLLTGERTPEADYDYVRQCVALAAGIFHKVTIETFPMTADEYAGLVAAGCTGVTLYQETYDPVLYDELHRWGPKKNFLERLAAPGRALQAEMRAMGLGVLLGLADPVRDALALLAHALHLRREFWRAEISISFPRLRPQTGDYSAAHWVSERFLAQLIFAFRICLPDTHLVLSTREGAAFRDGMAGLGISKMSAASRTTVGGYVQPEAGAEGQFEVSDQRDVAAICASLRARQLDPVFKNWDAAYRAAPPPENAHAAS